MMRGLMTSLAKNKTTRKGEWTAENPTTIIFTLQAARFFKIFAG
jgi:hypothetical protein